MSEYENYVEKLKNLKPHKKEKEPSGLEALERLKKVKVDKETPMSATFLVHDKRYCGDLSIIEKELKALEILKAFDFEIEDYTEELNGSVSVKFKRIILDNEEIDLLKEVLL